MDESESKVVYWDPVKMFWHDDQDNWYSILQNGTVIAMKLPVKHTKASAIYMTEALLAQSPDYFRRTIIGDRVMI